MANTATAIEWTDTTRNPVVFGVGSGTIRGTAQALPTPTLPLTGPWVSKERLMSILSKKPRVGQSGPDNPNWRGGRVIDPRGYVLVRKPDHARVDVRGYVYEHILVAENMLGRPILPTERVHHADENKSNNDPNNLIVTANDTEHFVYHRKRTDKRLPSEANSIISCACGCGREFPRYGSSHRPRRFVSGHNGRRAS